MYSTSYILALASMAISIWALPQPTPPPGYVSLPIQGRKASPVEYSSDATIDKRGTVQGSAVAANGDDADFHYMCPFQVGTQTFQVEIDTGSSNFWLLSNNLPADTTAFARPTYTPGSGATDQHSTFSVSYADGSWVRGENYADKVVFGAQTVSSVIVGAATATSTVQHPLPYESMSGLVGLGFASSFFGSLRSSLVSNLFSLTLHQDATGWLDFGWVNPARYTGSITYVPRETSSTNLWYVTPDNSYSINGTIYPQAVASHVLLDSGTSVLKVPSTVMSNYMAKVSGASLMGSGFVFPCSHVRDGTLPPFGISFNGVMITVPGSWMWNIKYSVSQDLCWSILTAVDTTPSSVVLGAVYHRTKFIVYDYGNNRVGFATQANLPAGRGPAP